MDLVEGPFLHGWVGQQVELLGSREGLEQLDAAVHGPAAAPVDLHPNRDVDILGQHNRVALLVPVAVEFVHHDVEPQFPVLRVADHVLQRRPALDVRVCQPLFDAPSNLLGRDLLQHARFDVGDRYTGVTAAALPGSARHEPHDPAVVGGLVEVVVAPGDEDRLEVGRALSSGVHLHRGEVGDSHHAHVAIAPGLFGDPLDEVVGVLAERHTAVVVVADHLPTGGA